MKTKKKIKFPKRVELATGYPWAMGLGTPESPYYNIVMNETATSCKCVTLNWPVELWSRDLPKYKLVLERVDNET